MPLDQIITDLKNLKILSYSGHKNLSLNVVYTGKINCIHCKSSKLRKKDSFIRSIRHSSIGLKRVTLKIKSHKFKCLNCDKYFNQRFEGIYPRARSSELFRKEVSIEHHEGISQAKLARRKRLSTSTIEKWYQRFIELENRKFSKTCPKHMGIDEHFFSRKKGYATTFADLGKRRVFNLELGRSEVSLKSFLSSLEGRDKVQTINMDLSETYRSIARKYFPNALIVADRFHVIRTVNRHFETVWKSLDSSAKNNRGLLSLVRRHKWNLKDKDQEIRLESYIKSVPGLKSLYDFKQKLNSILILKSLNKRKFKTIVPIFLNMVNQLKKSSFKPMRTLAKTLYSWRNEIMRMLRFTRNNSITEGLHNKMEMISRRAFGFRSFKNYKLRVKVHCGYQF